MVTDTIEAVAKDLHVATRSALTPWIVFHTSFVYIFDSSR